MKKVLMLLMAVMLLIISDNAKSQTSSPTILAKGEFGVRKKKTRCLPIPFVCNRQKKTLAPLPFSDDLGDDDDANVDGDASTGGGTVGIKVIDGNVFRLKFYTTLPEQLNSQESIEITDDVMIPASIIIELGYEYLVLKPGTYSFKTDRRGRKYIDILVDDIEAKDAD